MGKINLTNSILIAILFLAIFLRFWNLGNVPPSASLDEASIGYNAFSVLKTGGDEYGEFPLISQRGYDDWRRSTYLFLVVPSVGLFGLNAVSVRLPAVILSILTVLATYHIALLLFSKRSEFSSHFALFTAFLLAISPWHIYTSRLGHESNACLSFLVFGVLFFLQSQRDKSWRRLLISMVFFTLSMVSYYTGQILIPLFVVGLFIIYRKNILSTVLINKKVLIVFCIFLILLVPIFRSVFSPKALIRFQGTSTFKPEAHAEMFTNEVRLRNEAVVRHDILGVVFYNRRLFPVKVFIEGYFSHFNPKWLFANSSNESFKAPNTGLLYAWLIPFIIIGIFGFIFNPFFDRKIKMLIFLWFILGPLPGSVATQAPHAMRTYNMLPVWQFFASLGLTFAFYRLRRFNVFVLLAYVFCALLSLFAFYNNYFTLFPKEQSNSFQYALSKTIPYVLSQENNYRKIVFSNKDNLYQSYMFYLFYSKYDPFLYQRQGGSISGGYNETHSFGKFEFRPIIYKKENEGELLVGNISELDSLKKMKVFRNLAGEEEVAVVKN